VRVLAELSTAPCRLGHLDIDLSDVEAPAALFDAVESRFGAVDSLVINHARSQLGELGSLTAENLDLTWAVNVRASLLLVQEFAQRYVESS
jgi:3-oxoacyl-[acyl-carrier protein] reductase